MTQNKYYFQALDNFPYNLEETVEALNYAISFDGQNPETLCLLARVYSEVLKDYETAKAYFAEGFQEKMDSTTLPIPYISCLINNEDYAEAEKLIDYAIGIKGIDKATLYYQKALILERKDELKLSLKELKIAKKFAFNQNFMSCIEERCDFIKKKIKDLKSKKSKKKSSKKLKDKKESAKAASKKKK